MEVKKNLAVYRFNQTVPMNTFEMLRKSALSLVAAERWKMECGISESTSMDGLTQTTYFGQNKFQEEDGVEDMEIGKLGDKRSIKTCSNCEDKRICYGCGERGHLRHQCPGTNKPGNGDNGNGSRDGDESSKVKCYRCKRVGHFARECYARKTVDGQELPLPKPKVSNVRPTDPDGPGGEIGFSSSEED